MKCYKYKTSACVARGFGWLIEGICTVAVHVLFTPLFIVLLVLLVACGVLR